MKRKVSVNEKVEIVYKMEDGRISIVDGEIISCHENSYVMELFKRVVFSLSEKTYDLFEISFSRVEILFNSIKCVNSIDGVFNLSTEGIDDDGY
jgi:hypothetical protein